MNWPASRNPKRSPPEEISKFPAVTHFPRAGSTFVIWFLLWQRCSRTLPNHWSAVRAKGWAGKAVPAASVQLHPHPCQQLGGQTAPCLCIQSWAMPLWIPSEFRLTASPCSSFREMDYYRRAARNTQIQNSSKIIKIPQSLTVAFIFMKLEIGGAKKKTSRIHK